MRELQTVTAVIEALGGDAATRLLTGRKQNYISNWKAAGRFPAPTFLIISNELDLRGYRASPKLWGIAEPEKAAS